MFSRPVMCKPEMQAAISPVRLSGTHWGGAVYPGDVGSPKPDQLLARIAMVRQAGARFIGSINGRGFYHKSLDAEAVRLLDGSPCTYPPMNNAVFKCSLSPRVQEAFLATARGCVDMGMDGFILDSWLGEGARLCLCEHCLAFYRRCLREHPDEPRLKELVAAGDTDRFDYGEFLRARGHDRDTRLGKLPGGRELSRLRIGRVIDVRRRFWREIRTYAAQRSRPGFALTANVYSMGWRTFAIHDMLDYLTVELPYFGQFSGYPPSCSSIALHKKGEMVGKRCVCQPGCHDTARALIGKGATASLFKIWLAEAYACGNVFELIPREFAGYENGKVVHLDLPVAELVPYYRFVQEHAELYDDTRSVARVAVLYSMRGAARSAHDFEGEFQGLCKALVDAHILFDVLLEGDGELNCAVPTAEQLGRYDAVLVVRPQLCGTATVRRLIEFVRAGRKVMLTGPSFRSGSDYRSLSVAAAGHVLPPNELPSYARYPEVRDELTRVRLTRALGGDPLLRTDAPPELGLLCRSAGPRTILHFVNYAYDADGDRVRSTGPLAVRLSGVSGRTATFLSPDGNRRERVPVLRTRDGVACTVPPVSVYGVVVIR